jgi:hypothetical protein
MPSGSSTLEPPALSCPARVERTPTRRTCGARLPHVRAGSRRSSGSEGSAPTPALLGGKGIGLLWHATCEETGQRGEEGTARNTE